MQIESAANGPTDISLTFADYLSIHNRAARRFVQLSQPTIHFIEEIERVATTATLTTDSPGKSVKTSASLNCSALPSSLRRPIETGIRVDGEFSLHVFHS